MLRFPSQALSCLKDELELNPQEHQWCPHAPTAKQQEFLALECLEALYGGAAGGGKSDALLMAAMQYIDTPGYSAILFRRTYTDLALPGAIMQRSLEWLNGTAARWQERDKCWVFPSGARMSFGYLDGPRDHYRYQSAEFQFIAFDELTQFDRVQYQYLFSRLRRSSAATVPLRMRAATNPGGIGHDWVKARFLDAPESRVFVPAKLDDNPHTDQAAYETSLAQLDPITRQQLREGAWIRESSGLVYYAWRDATNLADELPDLPEGEEWIRILGADFGVTDPTAYVELAFTQHDPTVYVVRSEQWTDLSPSDAAEEAKRWGVSAGEYEAIIGDIGGLGKGFEAEFRKRFYVPMRAAQKSDKLGFQKLLNGDLHHGKLVVLPGNDQLVADLKTLAWKDESHMKEHPGLPNHLPDALLYGWRAARHWAWDERQEPMPKDPTERSKREMIERKAKIMERNRKRLEDDADEWIWGDDAWFR